MKIYSVYGLVLCCIFFGANIFCNPADSPRVYLADLTCGGTIPSSITAGQTFDIVIDVFNIEADADGTLDAGSSDLCIEIFRMDDTSGAWIKVTELVRPVAEIKAGTRRNLTVPMVINSPGNYRFDFFADATNRVDERDESNNTDRLER